ncbi:MAG: hypothetical protein V4598_19615 [Bdellovibrionota bacterium]
MKKLFAVLIAFHLMLLPVPPAHAGGIGAMANQIRGMAISGIGATILAVCPLGALSLSVKLFMAAGLVYLLGELAAGGGQKSSIESENNKVDGTTKGQGGGTQLATLEAQLKDKEEAKKVADKRAMFTAASMALMTAAAVAAATEIPREVPAHPAYLPPLGCNPAAAMSTAALKAAAIGGAFSFMGGGGLTGGLITGIGIAALGLSAMVGLMNVAAGRIKAFGALALLTGLALMDAKSASSKLAKEIEDLKKVIAQFKRETDDPGTQTPDTSDGLEGGVNSGSTSGTLAGTTSGTSGGGVTALPTGTSVTTNRSCISGNAEINSNCSNPLRVPALNSTDFNSAPDLQQVATTGVGLANDLASGNAGAKADIGAASLSASAAKLNEQLKAQVAKSNSFLKSKGQKTIDLEKDVADTVKSMNASIQNQAAKSGESLASLGYGDSALDPNAAAKVAQEIGAASTTAAIALPETKGDGAAVAAELAAADAEAAAAKAAKKAAEVSAKDALGKNLAAYETNVDDISANKETSLWRQVSNRYLLKYERFFERKKVEEKPAAAQSVAPQPAQ